MFMDWQLFRRRALGMSLLALVIVLLLWNLPQLEFALYPFRLFVTFIHEAGHGLAAIFTGGRFLYFEVSANGSGLATTRGGLRAAILPAGYLGAAFFGTGLFYITNRLPYPRVIAFGLGAGLVALSLLYGQTSRIALTVGTAFGVSLWLIGIFAKRYIIVLLLNILALMTALNAVLDMVFLTQDTTSRTPDGRILNDAAAFVQEIAPNTAPRLWAGLWAGFSLFMLGYTMYRSLVHPIVQDATLAHLRRTGQIEQPQAQFEILYIESDDNPPN